MSIEVLNTVQMLHAILDSIDEGIHVINEKGVTVYYNKIAAKHDGVDVKEVLGKHLLSVFPSLTPETSTLLKVIETGKPIYNQQQTYTNVRGELIDTVNTTIPIIVDHKLFGAVEIAKNLSKVKQLSEKLLDLQAKVNENKQAKTKKLTIQHTTFQMRDLITNNEQLDYTKKIALKAARTSSPILVYGETGTGKELLVQSIHNASSRQNQPFIAQNCAAIPSTLLEGILFGTVKGSFTGAIDRPGLFEIAHNGTLFLDEINSMPLDLQAKLLRVLQDGVVRRIGSTNGVAYNVRIITALNERPQECIRKQVLREDLYYRINVVSLRITPLRERPEDIERLTEHFIKKYNYRFEQLVTTVDKDVMELFHRYEWPGNVRELEHTIEAAMNLVEGDTIKKEHLPFHFVERMNSISKHQQKITPLRETMKTVEKELIVKTMSYTNGNIQQAAKLLKIPRQTLQYKLSKYDLK
ncbi:sigma-54 interaction domain-containing protein [Anaerobacillus sp. MEB173]|uniref:sigma-54 interaction domain-containing protein n=1 Tax=Anaerobacillus sp. MEB173 TaxID=3383345 RepID=UPI003F8E7667